MAGVIGGGALTGLFRPWNITILVDPILFLNMEIVIFIGTVCAFCFYQAGVGIVGKALYTGKVGDGKIFVYHCENVVRIRTADEGYDALQDEAE